MSQGETSATAGIDREFHAWLFAAKGIQNYIFGAGMLRDLIGASDLVAGVTSSDGDDLIGAVLAALDHPLGPSPVFSRRAGAAFCVHGPSAALSEIRSQFTLTVATILPGLEYNDALGAGSTELGAMRDAFRKVGGLRSNSSASVLPLGRPVMRIAALTGRPATTRFVYRREDTEEVVLLDAVMSPQRRRADELQGMTDGVANRFLPANSVAVDMEYSFPRTLRENLPDTHDNPWFPWRKGVESSTEDHRVAIVHADISGLGEAFQRLGSTFSSAKQNYNLATAIERAILAAAQQACREVLMPAAEVRIKQSDDQEKKKAIIPARPIVLGGDDVTVIVRADLAIDFASRLLELIEETTSHEEIGGLSACAGVAIVGRGTPFFVGNALAESLCSYAKREAKRMERSRGEAWPSALAFHLQTHGKQEDYQTDVLPGLEVDDLMLTANPYAVGEKSSARMKRASVAQLKGLASSIAAIPGARTALRTVELTLARGSSAASLGQWRRWRSSAARHSPESLFRMDEAIAAIVGWEVIGDYNLPSANGTTPLFDALRLLRIGAASARLVAA